MSQLAKLLKVEVAKLEGATTFAFFVGGSPIAAVAVNTKDVRPSQMPAIYHELAAQFGKLMGDEALRQIESACGTPDMETVIRWVEEDCA